VQALGVLEAALSDPTATVVPGSRRALGDRFNINKVYLVTLSNGVRAVWKPQAGEIAKEVRGNIPRGGQTPREVAAYLIDRAMGHLVGVPPAAMRILDGERGALLAFVPETGTAGPSALEMMAQQQKAFVAQVNPFMAMFMWAPDANKLPKGQAHEPTYDNLAVFDTAIGNLDRHLGNILLPHVPIDHGLSLPEFNFRQGTINFLFDRDVKLSPRHREALNHLLADKVLLEETLPELGIERRAIDAMVARVSRMLEDGATYRSWRRP